MKYAWILAVLWISAAGLKGQVSQQIEELEAQRSALAKQDEALRDSLQGLKLADIQQKLAQMGWPSADTPVVSHPGFALSYSEDHEQARWVAHMVLTDIQEGNEGRTNKFMEDPKVATGSAQEVDYFLKTPKPSGGYSYDGYGFDRGHLAPSADFKWSAEALAASYFYSNMSPQRPGFNRGKWARLEGFVRENVYRFQTDLYVVTGPVLYDGMPKVERSPNGMSLPDQYWKVVYNPLIRAGIAFLMPNQSLPNPVEWYAVPIDSIETLTGFDFFSALPDTLEERMEASFSLQQWLPEKQLGEALPIKSSELPEGAFNTKTLQDIYYEQEKEITVCGTVVSSNKSKKGNVFLNLDKRFPNQVFSISIWSSNVKNFSYAPEEELMGQKICVTGEVRDYNDTPSTNINGEEQLFLLGEVPD